MAAVHFTLVLGAAAAAAPPAVALRPRDATSVGDTGKRQLTRRRTVALSPPGAVSRHSFALVRKTPERTSGGGIASPSLGTVVPISVRRCLHIDIFIVVAVAVVDRRRRARESRRRSYTPCVTVQQC